MVSHAAFVSFERDGLLSLPQLEAITYAGQAHECPKAKQGVRLIG